MNFKNINTKDNYRSDRSNLIEDFYIPCLSETISYSRAVGYFSSTSIVAVSQGLAALIEAGGKMRLVASPYLSPEDIKAIKKGLKQKEEVISQAIIQEFKAVAKDRLACLSWLLSQGVLEIKLAVANNADEPGLYHDKSGILTDKNKNEIAFIGSINEPGSVDRLSIERSRIIKSASDKIGILDCIVKDHLYNNTIYLKLTTIHLFKVFNFTHFFLYFLSNF
ncbi:MAG: hypothetical protein ACRC2S_02280 [Waterburya sp.]